MVFGNLFLTLIMEFQSLIIRFCTFSCLVALGIFLLIFSNFVFGETCLFCCCGKDILWFSVQKS